MLRKKRKNAKYIIRHKEEIWCSRCKEVSVISSSDVEDLVCGYCMAIEMYREDLGLISNTVKYDQGWNLKKKYKAPDGKIFKFGVEIIGESNDKHSKKVSNKVKSVSRRTSRNSKSVLSGKNKKGNKK